MSKQSHGKGSETRQVKASLGAHEDVEKTPRKVNKQDFSSNLKQEKGKITPVEAEAKKKPTKGSTR